VTSQGQQLQTGLDIKPEQQPVSISHHMEHCPFCHAGMADQVIIPPHFELFALLVAIAQKNTQYNTPTVFANTDISPPSQAPPSL
jgi:hypothetical protein